ncbi:MAG: ABC transporter ATP-binding protein [Candidatus Hodarchaeales archaeon]
MARVKMEDVVKRFDDNTVLKSINIDIKDKELVVFVGPSGCGKSTAMRCVSGLEEVTSGKVFIGDRMVNTVPPKDRDVAMVFQNYALYPHMNIYDNIAFGLRARKMFIESENDSRKLTKEEIDEKVKKAVEILKIPELLDRKPSQLSGGQMQRVAMGRAIVREPQLFLMDEPLSNLDAKLRAHMRTELKRLQIDLGVTTIYVTHDQAEAMTLGDRVAVMHEGIFQQIDTPESVYDKPVNMFVAGFIGSPPMNFMKVKLNGNTLTTESFTIVIPEENADKVKQSAISSDNLFLGIRPEDIEDGAFAIQKSPESTVEAEVLVRENYGSDIFLNVKAGELIFSARVNTSTAARIRSNVSLVFDVNRIHIFDGETEKNLTL